MAMRLRGHLSRSFCFKKGDVFVASNEERIKRLLQKANTLPFCAGVYIMKNAAGKVIYVGKSRKLKSRVHSISKTAIKI